MLSVISPASASPMLTEKVTSWVGFNYIELVITSSSGDANTKDMRRKATICFIGNELIYIVIRYFNI